MADARIARASTRILIRPVAVAEVARTSLRTLTSSTPIVGVQIAQASLRILAVPPSTAQVAQVVLRTLVGNVATGLLVKVWDGAAWVDAPVKVWDGAAFVDPTSLKIWNGSAFV